MRSKSRWIPILETSLLTTLLGLALSGCDRSTTEPELPGTRITAAGGTVSDDAGRVTLVIPAGAVSEAVNIEIRQSAVAADARVVPGSAYRFEPSGLHFQVPVQVTLRFGEMPPGREDQAPYLWLHRHTGGAWVAVPGATVDLQAGTITAQLTSFSDYAAVFSDLAADLQELNATLNRLLHDPIAQDAVHLMSIAAGLLGRVDHPLFQALVLPVLEAAVLTACNARNAAVTRAQGTTITTYEMIADQLRPVYYWTAILARLEADDRCPPPIEVEPLHTQKLSEFVAFFLDRLNQPNLTTDYPKLIDEASLLMLLRGETHSLGLHDLHERLLDHAQRPLLNQLRLAAYLACRGAGTHEFLGQLRSAVLLIENVDFTEDDVRDDLQLCGTNVEWILRNDDDRTVGRGTLGGGSAPGEANRGGASGGVAAGTLRLAGDLRAFRCVNGAHAPDALIISFAGTEVRRVEGGGAADLLAAGIDLDVETTLEAAGVDPYASGVHRLTVARETAGCGGVYVEGSGIAVPLVHIDLSYPVEWSYTEDFERGTAGSEWSVRTVATSPNGQRFLGTFANQEVLLSLTGIPSHTELTIEFDYYAIGSWNGNRPGNPDVAIFRADGQSVLTTTFSNSWDPRDSQAYPDGYPGGHHPYGTGAAAVRSLGYPDASMSWGDSTYRLRFTIPHTASTLTFGFGGANLQEIWGVDNVRVTVR